MARKGRMFVMILLGFSFILTILAQEPEIQPELSEEEFINLINNILIEKVSIDMFDRSYGYYVYIRNTVDHNGKKINIRVGRYMTEIQISVNPGHFNATSEPLQSTPSPTEIPKTPEEIDARRLFTQQIESQADLTPPQDFVTAREYNIVVMNYKGTLSVRRGNVSIHFANIGALTPSPIPKLTTPRSQCYYYILIGILTFILILIILGIIIVRRRKIK